VRDSPPSGFERAVDVLFRVETDLITLTWSAVHAAGRTTLSSLPNIPGRLILTKRRAGLRFLDQTWRAAVPSAVAGDPDLVVGPRLSEQTSYSVFIRAKSGQRVDVRHRDPLITGSLREEDGGTIVHGTVNFRSDVGMSEFAVLVDGHPEFDFVVEVFPSKLDYASDYRQLLAEVQEILSSLALEYLRSTHQPGAKVSVPQPTHVEWLTLLRHVADDLQQAAERISSRPSSGLPRHRFEG
jgi:uncharacterized protein